MYVTEEENKQGRRDLKKSLKKRKKRKEKNRHDESEVFLGN